MDKHRSIIAILRGISPEESISVIDAVLDAGITRIEIPLNSPSALVTIARAVERFSEQARIGAGTVLTETETKAVADAGASFVVSPDCNEPVISLSRALQLETYPGIMTPSEAFRAIRAGANGLKIFPADALGPSGIRAMKAILPPAVPLYAVGGSAPENFQDYRNAGCTGFGLGTFLYVPGRKVEDISAAAQRAVAAYDALND